MVTEVALLPAAEDGAGAAVVGACGCPSEIWEMIATEVGACG